jgi:hypothetical protein
MDTQLHATVCIVYTVLMFICVQLLVCALIFPCFAHLNTKLLVIDSLYILGQNQSPQGLESRDVYHDQYTVSAHRHRNMVCSCSVLT